MGSNPRNNNNNRSNSHDRLEHSPASERGTQTTAAACPFPLLESGQRESPGSHVKLQTLSRCSSLKECLSCVGQGCTEGSSRHLSWWAVDPRPPLWDPPLLRLPGWVPGSHGQLPLEEHSGCALWLQFIQWNIHKSGLKVSEYTLPADATGPFVLSGYSGYKQVQVPRGRLFAFDSEGNYMLTCSATGGVIYKVPGLGGAVTVGREVPSGGLGQAEHGPPSLSLPCVAPEKPLTPDG